MSEELITLIKEKYKIYKRNGYYLCISEIESNNYQLFIGFTDKDLKNLSKDEIINEIRKVSDLVNSLNRSGIFVLPEISPSELEQAAIENDDKLFYKIMSEKIQPITREIYEILKSDNKNLESVIRMIKQSESDRKFIDWMDMKLMESGVDYVQDIEYEKLKEDYRKKQEQITLVSSPDVPQLLQQPKANNRSGIAPIDRTYENMMTQQKSNVLVKRLVKPNEHRNSSGFSNIGFIAIVIMVALILGIGISYLIIK